MKTTLPSDHSAIIGVIDPDANAAGTFTTDWIDMAAFGAIMAIVMVGTLGALATVDAKLEQATDSSGTDSKDVDDKAISQLTKAGGDDDKQVIINLFDDELDADNEFTHVRLSMTVAVATSDCTAVVLGSATRYGPASNHDLASVGEII